MRKLKFGHTFKIFNFYAYFSAENQKVLFFNLKKKTHREIKIITTNIIIQYLVANNFL